MRLIDADEAYKVLTDYYHQRTENQHKALKEAIERMPTVDAEEVVRCKDCTHNKTLQKGTFGDILGYDGECNIVRLFIRDNYYCVWGEKDET